MNRDCMGCPKIRTWALAIGWMQLVSCGIFLTLHSVSLILFVAGADAIQILDVVEIQVATNGTSVLEIIVIKFIILGIYGASVIAAVYLIVGVRRKDAEKLKVWIVFEGVFLSVGLCAIFMLVFGLFEFEWSEIARDFVLSVFSIVCLWIVCNYRKEVQSHHNFSDREMEISCG